MELDHPSHVRLEFWFDFASYLAAGPALQAERALTIT